MNQQALWVTVSPSHSSDERLVLIAAEGSAVATIHTDLGRGGEPRSYELRRQNGALVLVEVTK